MTLNHKVSVVLTSYNHARYLRQAIDSVLAQTYTDFELIIYDDASTDDSWQIIQGYSDARIRLARNETSKRGWSFRKAIKEVRGGDYIAIHHSDDAWEPRKLEKQVAFMEENPACAAVFTQVSVINEEGQPFNDPAHFYYKIFDQPNRSRYEWLHYFFFYGNVLCHPSVLMRRACFEACGGYRLGFSQVGDLDTWVRMCLQYEIHVLPEKLVRFRVRADNLNLSGDRPEVRMRLPFEILQIYQNYRGIQSMPELIKIFPEAEQYNRPDGFDISYALGMLALQVAEKPATNLFGLTLLFEALNSPERAARLDRLYGFTHSDFVAMTARSDVFSTEMVHALQIQLAGLQASQASLTGQAQALQSQLAGIQASQALSTERENVLRSQLAEIQANQVLATERENALRSQLAEAQASQALSNEREHALRSQLVGIQSGHAFLTAQLAEIQKSKAWKMAMAFRRIRLVLVPPGSRRAAWLRGLLHALGWGKPA